MHYLERYNKYHPYVILREPFRSSTTADNKVVQHYSSQYHEYINYFCMCDDADLCEFSLAESGTT